MAAAAGPQAWPGLAAQETEQLFSRAYDPGWEHWHSPLLLDMKADVDVPLPPSVMRTWFAVAMGGTRVCNVDDAVTALRAAAFLQDKHTYAKAASSIAASMAAGFQEWQQQRTDAPSSSNCVCTEADVTAVSEAGGSLWALDDEPIDPNGGPSCLEVLEAMLPQAACMHPHDLYAALGALPFSVIARLPCPLQREAVSSYATSRDRADVAPGPIIALFEMPCYDSARILICAASLPTLPLASVIFCAGWDGQPCRGRRRCPWPGRGLAATLRAHPAALRTLVVSDVYLDPSGARALAAALSDSHLRLALLALDVDIGRDEADVCAGELVAAMHAQTALTSLDLPWPAAQRARGALHLSHFPRLRTLSLQNARPCWGDMRPGDCVWESGLSHLSHLKQLDLQQVTDTEEQSQRIVAHLRHCTALTRLILRTCNVLDAMSDARVAYPNLSAVCVLLKSRYEVSSIPLAWLAQHTGVQFVMITAETARVWRQCQVDVEELARHLPSLLTLTTLGLHGLRTVNSRGEPAAGGLLRALASLPRLQQLTIEGAGGDDAESAAQWGAPTQEAVPAAVATAGQRRWLRTFEAPPSECQDGTRTPAVFPALTRLTLPHNHLSTSQLRTIASLRMPNLEHLDLADNNVGAKLSAPRSTAHSACREWFASLVRLTALRTVSLARNDIDDAGALRVLCALCGLRELFNVDLSHNPIQALPESCKLFDAIHHLQAACRCCGGEGGEEWADEGMGDGSDSETGGSCDGSSHEGGCSVIGTPDCDREFEAMVTATAATWDDMSWLS